MKCLKGHSEVPLGWSTSSKTSEVVGDCGILLQSQINLLAKLFSLPSTTFFISLSADIYKPRKLPNKPVHILYLVTAIIICILMFSTQLWNTMETDCEEDRKLISFVGAPIIFIHSSMLCFLLKGTTPLRML